MVFSQGDSFPEVPKEFLRKGHSDDGLRSALRHDSVRVVLSLARDSAGDASLGGGNKKRVVLSARRRTKVDSRSESGVAGSGESSTPFIPPSARLTALRLTLHISGAQQ